MVACHAVKQIIGLHYTLHMLSVLLDRPSWLFGNNKSVITSSTIPHSSLSKPWNALSYHKGCKAIVADIVHFEFISGAENPADILTKALPWYKACVHVEPLQFWKGETLNEAADAPGLDQRGVTM